LISLSLPVPVSTYFVENTPVLRTARLRRLVATRADAFRNHCTVVSSETFIIILVCGAEDTSSANALLTFSSCESIWKENRIEIRAPRAVCRTLAKPGYAKASNSSRMTDTIGSIACPGSGSRE
jgi:hypothetical protein